MRSNKTLNTKKGRNKDRKVLCATFFLSFFVVSISFAQSVEVRKKIIHDVAAQAGPPYFAKIAARIKTNFKTEEAYKQLDTLLAREQGDMFWMYGCAGLYYSCKNELLPEYKEKVRTAWKLRTPYRGDTDNHFLMYYSSLYLMAQEWSTLPENGWFLGKSSKQITKESKEYLEHWIDETVRYGMSEFDSPRYMYYYITPLVLLAEYVADKKFRTKCSMMLELLLADYAHDYYFGNYAGAHSRVGFDQVLDSRKTETAGYGQFYFEDSVSLIMPDLAFAAMGKWECPDIIKKIAKEKHFPFFSKEIQPARRRLSDTARERVTKKMYMTNLFALGSSGGGLYSPIQQQSWSLTLNTPKSPNVICGLHPSVTAEELGEYFPEPPEWQLSRIEQNKRGYSSEDKLIGGSKYERIVQSGNILVANYEGIPDSARYQHIDLILPGWGKRHSEIMKADGYEVVYQFDSVVVIMRIMSSYTIMASPDTIRFRVHVTGGANRYTVEAYSLDEFERGNSEPARMEYENEELHPRLNSKYIFLKDGDNVVHLKREKQTRILDFDYNRIMEKE